MVSWVARPRDCGCLAELLQSDSVSVLAADNGCVKHVVLFCFMCAIADVKIIVFILFCKYSFM